MRSLGHGKVEVETGTRKCGYVVDLSLSDREEALQARDFGRGGVLGRQFGRQCFDRTLRVENFGGADAGEIELNGKCFRELPRVTVRDTHAATGAHLDLDHAERR